MFILLDDLINVNKPFLMVEYSSSGTTCANNCDLQIDTCLQLGSLNGGTCLCMLVSAWTLLEFVFLKGSATIQCISCSTEICVTRS